MFCFVLVSLCVTARGFHHTGEDNSLIPNEKWGYVTVRPKAHMFWWAYGAQNVHGRSNMPLILWLQGGPGGSGTGFGNFYEIGPLDADLKPRSNSWLLKPNLLFVDNPVGTGFSYVDDYSALTTNVSQIADDLFVIFSKVLDQIPAFKRTPFYVFCESYGGKMTAAFGERLHQGIRRREIDCNFKGVALGDSWISPVDSTLSWGDYLYQFNLLDGRDLRAVNQMAQKSADAAKRGNWNLATRYWGATEGVIDRVTDGVNPYNVLQHNTNILPTVEDADFFREEEHLAALYSRHVGMYQRQSLDQFMNGAIRRKLGVIPSRVRWGGQARAVFQAQSGDFMKPVITTVSKLISYGLKVVVFQGQLDMICDTPAAETWIKKLHWSKLGGYLATPRKALYVGANRNTQAFLKSYDNFALYVIMNAGHMVPYDNPEMSLKMVGMVVG